MIPLELGDVRAVVFDLDTTDGWHVHEEGWLEVTRVEGATVAEIAWHGGDGSTWLVAPSGAHPIRGEGAPERAWRLVGLGYLVGGLPLEGILSAATAGVVERPPTPDCGQPTADFDLSWQGQTTADLRPRDVAVPDLPALTALLGPSRCVEEVQVAWTATPVRGGALRRLRRESRSVE